ncbi:cytochrome P450 [Fusarium oxysporum Fo47]|uniref:cytochrome P450 n=1 Tax=Fusarium oxysporum Fo47 TaxID=660027 RepID=UPI001597C1CB|nr:cytochrome P450 [Fusarium oxysporum Fo47]QKD62054.1 cytochrome P450 [Fusarium oxysporum Fo47]
MDSQLEGGFLRLETTGLFLLFLCTLYLLYHVTCTIFFNPLSRLPGPWISCWTDAILKYHWLKGTKAQYVHRLHQRYGPHEVDISDITAVKEIHRIKYGYRKAPFYQNLVPNTNNLFNTLDVEFHRHHRRLLSSPLSESSLKSVEPTVDDYVKTAIASMKREMDERGTADVAKFWLFMATDIIVELSFGESFGILKHGKKNQYIKDLEGLAAKGSIRSTFPTLITIATKLPLPIFKETAAAAQRIRDYSAEAVARYKRDFANNPAAAKPTLFGKLFEAGEAGLSDDEIRAEAQAYIVAGSDTTATTLTYLVYSVCCRGDARQKLVKELMELPDDFGHSDLRELRLATVRFFRAFPNACVSSIEGMSQDDMELRAYFLLTPKGGRCLIQLDLKNWPTVSSLCSLTMRG